MTQPIVGGAPTKFTDEVKEKLLSAIRKGAPYEIACNYAGISYECLNKWRKKAKKENIPEFVEFFVALKEAEGHTALIWLAHIDAAMKDGSWQAAAWKLERRYYEHFSSNPVLLKDFKELTKMFKKVMDTVDKGDANGNKEAQELHSEGN